MEFVLPMYNVHLDFSLANVGKNMCIIHSQIWYVFDGPHSGLNPRTKPSNYISQCFQF